MKKAGLGLLVSTFALGCVAPRSCPPGEVVDGPTCVPEDGGNGEAGTDAGSDAGPRVCDPACDEGSFCVDGACVACRDDGDCADPLAPSCSAGACASCAASGTCTPEQLAAEAAAIICAAAAGAVDDRVPESRDAELEVTVASLVAILCSQPERSPEVGTLLAALASGRATVDPQALRECLAPAREHGIFRLASAALIECSAAFTGTIDLSGACSTSIECLSGYCALAGCGGVCQPRVGAGASCDDDQECLSGECRDAVCAAAPVPSPGAPCGGDDECSGELVCGADGLCAPPPDAGEACDDSYIFPCAPGLVCDRSETCVTRRTAGQSCDDPAQCAPGLACIAGSCVPVVHRGAPCDGAVACASGTECVEGRCRALPDLGEPCTGGCYRGTCEGGTCASATSEVSCVPGLRAADALDPCGAGRSCRTRDGDTVWTCRAASPLGGSCSVNSLFCDEPSATCEERVCVAACVPG